MAYRGTWAPIPLGVRGLDGRKNPTIIPVGSLRVANSVAFDGRVLKGEGGAARIDSNAVTGAPICRGLHDWIPTEGTQRLISYWSNGIVYKEVSGNMDSVSLATGLAQSVLGQFVEGGQEALGNARKLYFFNGSSQVRVLSGDGTALTELNATTQAPADWTGTNFPTNGVVHGQAGGSLGGGYLWGMLGHRLYRSSGTDHSDFRTTTYHLLFFPGIGTKLMQGISFNGTLYLFKDRGLFYLDDSDVNATNWVPRILNTKIGVISPQGAVVIGASDILLLDQDWNFQLLTAVRQLSPSAGEFKASSLSYAMNIDEWIRDNVNLNKKDLVTSRWYPSKQEAHFSVCSKTSDTPNMRLIFDFSEPNNVKFRWSTRDAPFVLALRKHPTEGIEKPIFGDGAGFVYEMDTAAITKDAAGYAKTFEVHQTDFSHIDPNLGPLKKHFDYLVAVFRSLGPETITVVPIIDGRRQTSFTLEMQGPGTGLGDFILGTHALGGLQGSYSRERRINGHGRSIGFEVDNSGNNQNFNLTGFYVGFRVGRFKGSALN